jgi:Holliday junction DNA helicase RuvB subunit
MADRNIPEQNAVPRYVTCACAHCGGGIEFDAGGFAEGEKRTVACPHCGLEATICVPVERAGPPPVPPVLRKSEAELDSATAEVLKWYRRAAELGDAEYQFQWATAVASGCGVAQDYTEAASWFLKAAEQGHPTAQFNVGACYWNGHGVAMDHAEGAKWILRAAEQGDSEAQKVLGECYERGDGVAQDVVEGYKWMKLAAAQDHPGAQRKCDDLEARLSQEQIEAAQRRIEVVPQAAKEGQDCVQGTADSRFVRLLRKVAEGGDGEAQMLLASIRAAEMKPDTFSRFIGQERVKARLELAVAAARRRNEAVDHILLIGRPGAGKATLANIVAKTMGANLKSASGPTVEKAGDLAGLLTNLEAGDVLFIDDIHRLRKGIAEYFYPATRDFKLDVIIDQGENARSVRLNLPRFTLVGTAPRREMLTAALQSCFPIVEHMDAYSVEELASIADRFAESLEVEIDAAAAERIARSADGTPVDILNRLRHVRDYAHIKGDGKITAEVAGEALRMLSPAGEAAEASNGRTGIPSEVRREVWRRDAGRCVKCGSRDRLEYDHIIPVMEGGSNTARNVELLCEKCNRAKSDLIR